MNVIRAVTRPAKAKIPYMQCVVGECENCGAFMCPNMNDFIKK